MVLFYPNGEMRKTSKRKLLKEAEITEYSKLPLLGYQYASGTVIDFMATIQPTNFSKFERFSNMADGIIYKIISSFQESDLLVIVPDRYDVELSIKSAERLHRTANSAQEIEITGDRKVPKSFQNYLSNASNKTNMVNYTFQQWKEISSERLSLLSLSGKC